MERIISLLEPLLTTRRAQRMRDVLATRSDHVAFAFERMVDPHNFSAVLRTMDALSFQDAYLVAPQERVNLSRGITQGTDRWLTVQRFDDMESCVAALRRRNYRIYASHVDPIRGRPLRALDLNQRVALIFGNEHAGVSPQGLALADDYFHIPMLGFVESLNLSVAAALCAHHLRGEMERLAVTDAHPERFLLPPRRQRELYAQWLRHSVRNADRILASAGCGESEEPS